jgi:hypothetical protein
MAGKSPERRLEVPRSRYDDEGLRFILQLERCARRAQGIFFCDPMFAMVTEPV